MIALFLARYGLHLALIAGLGVVVATWDHKRIDRAKKQAVDVVVSASEEKGKQANAKNEKIRRAAAVPGAADRLRSDPATCPDCKR